MGQFTDARGVCLFQSLEDELYDWAEHIPYDFPGDDGTGYAECRETYDNNIEPQVVALTYQLESAGRHVAALGVRRAFDALAAQCKAVDAWCEGNPVPEDVGIYWPVMTALAAVGDPDGEVISECYREIRRAKGAVATSEVAVPSNVPVIHRSPSGDTVEWESKVYPVNSGWADAFAALVKASGQPVGLTPFVGKTTDALAWLKTNAPGLCPLIKRADGNKGYCLKLPEK